MESLGYLGSHCQAQQVLPLSRCLVLSKLGGGSDELTPEKLENKRVYSDALNMVNSDLMVIQ